MKTRLYQVGESYYIKKPGQELERITRLAARRFILNFLDPEYTQCTENLPATEEDYGGELIAAVNDDNCLLVRSASLFKGLLENDGVTWISVKDFADMYAKKPAIVRRHCQNKRIEGALLTPGGYIIPEDAPYPK